MRRVTNQKNAEILRGFRSRIIEPAFGAVHDLATSSTPIKSTRTFRSLKSRGVESAFSRALGLIVGGKSLETELVLLSQEKHAATGGAAQLFQSQTQQLVVGNYALSQVAVADGWRRVFVSFFYERFFSDGKLWDLLGRPGYTRQQFHTNFYAENGQGAHAPLNVCPYCDLDTVQSIGNSQIEHLLPKGKYPFLSMSAENLFSSCLACNSPGSGKGTQTAAAVLTPYHAEIGELVEFSVDHAAGRIDLADGGDARVHGFLDLLQLPRRYSKPRIYDLAALNVTEVLHSVSGQAPTEAELRRYFERFRLHHPLYYVTREVCIRAVRDGIA